MPLTAKVDPGQHHFTADVVYFYVNNGEQRVLARADEGDSERFRSVPGTCQPGGGRLKGAADRLRGEKPSC
jgi:hypothetical protein